MKISREEFERNLDAGQQLLLHVLANSSKISVENFYKVANTLEYFNLFSGVFYTVLSLSSDTPTKGKAVDNRL